MVEQAQQGRIHSALRLKIAVGEKHLGKVKNKTVTWGALVNKFQTPQIDQQHTLPQYLALSKDRQNDLKNVGYFVGGHCDNGTRNNGSVKTRSVITLDADALTPAQMFDLKAGFSEYQAYEFLLHTTRKHCNEAPRARLIFPLTKECTAEQYEAVARILGSLFDHTMECFDPVGFRVTQLMFWASVCKDAEYTVIHNPGQLIDPDEILNAFGDWKDHSKLPRCDRDSSIYTPPGKKPEDPTTKRGIVGAFARAYTVPQMIAKFMPDLYVDPVEKSGCVRYTFVGGTTSQGAIVYNDGKFLYSHHMHDPAAGHSQNSFDLLRIHKFGHLDDSKRGDVLPTNMPSFKAMRELLEDDEVVMLELVEDQLADGTGVFDDLGHSEGIDEDGEKTTAKEKSWLTKLDLDMYGTIKPTLHNVELILSNDKRLTRALCWNELEEAVVQLKDLNLAPLPLMRCRDAKNGTLIHDTHLSILTRFLSMPKKQGGYGIEVATGKVQSAMEITARRHTFHPLKDYFKSLTWDGRPRLETLFVDYLNAEDNAYHRETARLTLIAGVARVFEPGHKWDQVPIFVGLQGVGKSRFIQTLAVGYYQEMTSAFEKTKEAIETMSGAFVIEIPELTQFRKSESEAIKQFFSSSRSKARMAYGKFAKLFERQCIFFGSTNHVEFLKDETGNRRFWPIVCNTEHIDIDKLQGEVDQIWAEAYVLYKRMREIKAFGDLPLYLTDQNAAEQAVAMQNEHRVMTVEEEMASQIEDWLYKPCPPSDLGGKRSYRDDGVFDNNGDITLVVRKETCLSEIAEKVFRTSKEDAVKDARLLHQLGRAVRMIKGIAPAPRAHYGDYGRQRMYKVLARPEDIDDEL